MVYLILLFRFGFIVKIGYQRMTSQLDYWKAMNAKNAETMPQGSRVPKDSQADTQSKNLQPHDQAKSSRFHGESHEEFCGQKMIATLTNLVINYMGMVGLTVSFKIRPESTI